MANDTSINNSSDVESEPAGPSQTPTPAVDQLYFVPGGGYQMWGTEVPNMPGTRVGDVLVNDTGDKWNWMKGDWDYANLAKPPSRDKGGIKPGDETPARDYYNPIGTPTGSSSTYTGPTVTKREDGVITYNAGTGYEAFPGRLPIVLPGSSVKSTPILDLSQPPVAPVTPPKPPKPITLPGSSVTSTPSIVEPTTVPIPARRMQEALNPYNGYINYDPDEILAAAMKVMRGRGAGRSMMY
jgi:hypothetical protein